MSLLAKLFGRTSAKEDAEHAGQEKGTCSPSALDHGSTGKSASQDCRETKPDSRRSEVEPSPVSAVSPGTVSTSRIRTVLKRKDLEPHELLQELARPLCQLVDSSHIGLFANLLGHAKHWRERAGGALVLGELVGKTEDCSSRNQIVLALLEAYRKEEGQNALGCGTMDFVVEALGKTKDTRAIAPLIACMNRFQRSHEAIVALGHFSDDSVIDELLALLRTDPSRRGTCIETLATIGNHRAVPAIIEVLRNRGAGLDRKPAAKALGALGDSCAIEALIETLLEDNRDPGLREAAAVALGLLKDARATQALREAQKDVFEAVRTASTLALAKLGIEDAQAPVADEAPKVMGVLVLCHGKLQNPNGLLWEIAIQQSALGYENALGGKKEIVVVAGDAFNDMAYVYASVRAHFGETDDLVSRTFSYDFRSGGGDYGKYCVIFDKPKVPGPSDRGRVGG